MRRILASILYRLAVYLLQGRSKSAYLAEHPRSAHWPVVRREFLEKQGCCQACGSTEFLTIHHILPSQLRPDLELDQNNLITLCEHPSHNCHLIFGHLLTWTFHSPFVRTDTQQYL